MIKNFWCRVSFYTEGFPDTIELIYGLNFYSSVIDQDDFHVAGDKRSSSHEMGAVTNVP